MNDDVFQGKWKEIRGSARGWWAKLTNYDLDRIEGKVENLSGVLQKKYGYTREQAGEEIDRHVKEYDLKHPRKP